MLHTVITKKFANRLINHIFDVWDYEYVLNRLPELDVTTAEVHNIVASIRNQFWDIPRTNQYNQCKKELLKLVLEKRIIIDP